MCSEKSNRYRGYAEKAKENRRKLKGERLQRFEQNLKEVSPPSITLKKTAEAISFLGKAQAITKSSFSGFGGLDRAEINLSFKNCMSDYYFLKDIEDIGWAIEYLDEKLKEYFSKKKE